MPHCIIEYAKELKSQLSEKELINAVLEGTVESHLFSKNDIKIRLLPFKEHVCGDHKIDFIHVTLKILSGRTSEQKKALSKQVLSSLEKLALTSISLTVEVMEIERSTYSKIIL